MDNTTKMTIGASLALDGIIERLIYLDATKGEERNLPFSIKYKLRRNKNLTEKDFLFYEEKRQNLIKEYGAEDAESHSIKVKEENLKVFTEEIGKIRKMEVVHEFLKFKPGELSELDVPGFSIEEISLFMLAFVEDPSMVEDLNDPIEKGDN